MEAPHPYLRSLGRAIRRERMRQGLTQTAAAMRWQVSRSWLSQLENGRGDPGLRQLVALSDRMGVPLSTLFSRARDLRESDADDG